jgi:hypothetical protein
MVELNMSNYTVVRGKYKMHWPEIAGEGHKSSGVNFQVVKLRTVSWFQEEVCE